MLSSSSIAKATFDAEKARQASGLAISLNSKRDNNKDIIALSLINCTINDTRSCSKFRSEFGKVFRLLSFYIRGLVMMHHPEKDFN